MSGRPRSAGFSYLEVLVATVVLAIALVPAVEALRHGILGAAVHERVVAQRHHASGLLEEVLAEPFSALAAAATPTAGTPTAYSDPVGTPERRLVYLRLYDADDDDNDPFSNPEPDLLWVRVEIEGTAVGLETLVTP